MSCFCIELEARAPERNCLRSWQATIERDLLGDWLVEFRWGRIGTCGQHRRHATSSRDEAVARVRQSLKRRLSAPRRIGTVYQCRSLHDPEGWLSSDPVFSPPVQSA